jgi:hypothetical protein
VDASGSWDVTSEKINTDSLSIVLSGSGDIKINDLTADSLSVMISGSGEMDAAGEVVDQKITVSGSAKIRSGDLRSETAHIDISGSGKERHCTILRQSANQYQHLRVWQHPAPGR